MEVLTKKFSATILVALSTLIFMSQALADVKVSLRSGVNFVVEQRPTGADNLVVFNGGGVEVPRGSLDTKSGSTSGGQVDFYDGGGTNSVTVQAPDDLAADVLRCAIYFARHGGHCWASASFTDEW